MDTFSDTLHYMVTLLLVLCNVYREFSPVKRGPIYLLLAGATYIGAIGLAIALTPGG